MTVDLSQFIRSDIASMEKYTPAPSLWDLERDFGKVIKLDAGENQFGYSPKVSRALKKISLFNYYPDPEYKRLRTALAIYTGSRMENVIVGAGSDELIDLLLRLILDEGDEIIDCPPTFNMYSILTKFNKGVVVSVARKDDFSLDTESILRKINTRTKAIFICSPNNPTGNSAKKSEIITLLKTGKLVIVDEAYYEFCNKSVLKLLSNYNNLIILRTFSKWAGIAGLRLGYGVMNKFIVSQLIKIKTPYNLSLAAEIAGNAALSDMKTYEKIIKKIVKERERMFEELNKIKYLTVFPSEANFLFIRVNGDFRILKEKLESKKIFVRFYPSRTSINFIRLSIGTKEQNNHVISAFKELEIKKRGDY